MSAVTASLCSTLLIVGVFVFVSADQKIITAASGQNVTLTCRAPNSNNIIVVEWSRADLETEYVLLYRNKKLDPENQHPSFKNRVDLQDRQMKDGDVSLILNNVTTADNGTYECRIFMRERQRRKRAHLKTDPISSIYLSVVPPGQTGGGTEDGSVGLKVGLIVPAVVAVVIGVAALVVAVVGFVIYKNRKKQQSQGSYI
ncbi:cell surface A33 antigen-like [Oreochromis aureus]|uniref:cell surface A33 antigen-like n=1 Tax=Oreochromis aureus TaxID=47969 RepID=UPI001954D576|nr:cell surface A33 antigen-like [Oreochromis aureus]